MGALWAGNKKLRFQKDVGGPFLIVSKSNFQILNVQFVLGRELRDLHDIVNYFKKQVARGNGESENQAFRPSSFDHNHSGKECQGMAMFCEGRVIRF